MWIRSLACATIAAFLAQFAPGPFIPCATAWDSGNLLVNSGAEDGPGSPCGRESFVPLGWQLYLGNARTAEYNCSGWPCGLMTCSDPGSPSRGRNLFFGGSTSRGVLVQIVPIPAEACVADGTATLHADGYFGGYQQQNDQAFLSIRYLDANQAPLPVGEFTLGGVSSHDRGSKTGMLWRELYPTPSVPAQAQFLVVSLISLRAGGTHNDAIADDLHVFLRCRDVAIARSTWTAAKTLFR